MSEKEEIKKGRMKKVVTDVDRNEILHFYQKRTEKFKEENPYAVTMFQDNNPQLVKERNKKEIESIMPILSLDADSKVLDVACGIGRWYDAMNGKVKEYCGVDFCAEIIQLAKKRHKADENVDFLNGSATELKQVLQQNGKGTYNRVLIVGVLMYLNDADIRNALSQILEVIDKEAVICIREPIGIEDRLTLKEFYSEELESNYSAIYRTRDELMDMFRDVLIPAGFQVEKEGWMFEESLNNRSETAQYYFVFRRYA